MNRLLVSFTALALLAGALPSSPVTAAQREQDRGDQQSAREAMQAGRTMRIEEIERRTIRRMGEAEYLGHAQYDRAAQAYRLKFIEEGRVIWVDVDARTAAVLRISR